MAETDTPSPELPPEPAPTWEPLSVIERRVLGVLIEKQKTSKSPDSYPMTLNALTTGCNQKSNRDPVLELDDDDVEETLMALQKKGLTNKIVGGRAERFRHLLYDVWKVTKVEMAVLAELLLRGPQTEGDLRGRASRMDDIADLETLRGLIQQLLSRNLVQYLTPAERRGAMISHGFHAPDELATLQSILGSGSSADVPATPRASAASTEARLNQAFEEIALLRKRIEVLEGKSS